MDWYAEQFMGEHPDRLTPARAFTAKEPRLRTDADDDEHRAKIERARLIWRHATPMEGTPAAGYLATRLGADLPGDLLAHPDLRFHPAPFYGGESTFLGDAVGGLVALMRDPLTGEPTGLHRTFISVGLHRLEKRMLGRKGMVMLSPFDSVSHGLSVCEGIETGVAIMHRLGFAPVWCALSAGGVGTFPVLPGVDALTVFADNDLPDKNGRRAGQMAADRCAQRWREAGREMRVATPMTPDSDFADEVAQ
ncbi:toprim domain-containing protein [Nitratireductor sp. GISD-1A_MAKvit]|uniref:DUF7146 domain-containing protein n=1 Tax=Nitratireductor sp. GISD-1A_MAKvit TaxID=3234198 RepID=UPI003467982B